MELRYVNVVNKIKYQTSHLKYTNRSIVVSADFTLDANVKATIAKQHKAFVEKTNTLDMNYMEGFDLNKKIAKSFKVSPDAIMQLVVQVG